MLYVYFLKSVHSNVVLCTVCNFTHTNCASHLERKCGLQCSWRLETSLQVSQWSGIHSEFFSPLFVWNFLYYVVFSASTQKESADKFHCFYWSCVHYYKCLYWWVCWRCKLACVCHTDECEMPHAAENKDLFWWLFFPDIIRVLFVTLLQRVAKVPLCGRVMPPWAKTHFSTRMEGFLSLFVQTGSDFELICSPG